ncbi:hypothetical protein [Aquimarina sp. AU474]|uniref:hypothetical protein n=1 Tax=Aquimarina sp. AU474 TaxID=2108529 RepID=UPI000D68ED7A|nr:hypothetical protein [Aquimarina sp. AU474]
MKYVKKIVVYIIVLEILNLIVGVFSNGTDAFLPLTGFNDPPLYYDMDSLYGVTRQKNSKQMINYPWGGVVNQINAHGFRDDEFNKGGVLVLGNSFVEGFGMDNKDRFSEVLEEKLNTPINNAGSGGVWTPVQGIVLLKHLLNDEKLKFDKVIFVMTPGEVANIGKRNPKSDANRSFPYKNGEEITFYKAKANSFGTSLSLTSKVKRFSKSLLVFKIYNMFKYYGTAKNKQKNVDFNQENLDWVVRKIEEQKLNDIVEVVVINNLGRIHLNGITDYKSDSSQVNFNVIEFPDDLNNYFVANGHLNEKGNKILADLLYPIVK